MCIDAWEKVTPKTIANCFEKAWVVMRDHSMPLSEKESQTNDEYFESEHYCHVKRNIPFDMYVNFDDNIATFGESSVTHILLEDAILQDKIKNQKQANLHT